MKKETTLAIRMTGAEKEQLEAEANGKTLSRYVRDKIFDKRDNSTEVFDEPLTRLRRTVTTITTEIYE